MRSHERSMERHIFLITAHPGGSRDSEGEVVQTAAYVQGN